MTKLFTRHCSECGTEFQAKVASAEFCCQEHRLAYNNRRRDRGAMLFDLYVHTRFNRKASQEKGLQTLIDRMVGNWVEEDRAVGRKPMRELQDCIQAALPHTAIRTAYRAGK